jgi:hypothetical protein
MDTYYSRLLQKRNALKNKMRKALKKEKNKKFCKIYVEFKKIQQEIKDIEESY